VDIIPSTGGLVDKNQFNPSQSDYNHDSKTENEKKNENETNEKMEKIENEKISVTSSTSLIDNSLKKSPVQIKDTHSDKIKKTAVINMYT
jgi:hypothetical protein